MLKQLSGLLPNRRKWPLPLGGCLRTQCLEPQNYSCPKRGLVALVFRLFFDTKVARQIFVPD